MESFHGPPGLRQGSGLSAALRLCLAVLVFGLAGCAAPQKSQEDILVRIEVDGGKLEVQTPAGSSVQDVLTTAGVELATLDRTDPPLFTILGSGSVIRIVRVQEKFEIEQQVVPFERQTLRNESLPEGETRLSQPGANGIQELTYRILQEDGVEVARTVVKTVVLTPAVPEIMLVGSQTPFQSLKIPGTLAYLSAGNAWVMEGTTGKRRLVVSTADLDGRIFTLSPNRQWLLFTRGSTDTTRINALWAARLDEAADLVDLKAANIIHSAAFAYDSYTVAYTTVEPRSTAPGWQANNDLLLRGLGSKGLLGSVETLLEVNSGGVYGWWGSAFTWSPRERILANARPDRINLLNTDTGEEQKLLDLLPFQTGGDWAWVPGVGWSPDGNILYTVTHEAQGGETNPEASPVFNLTAVSLVGGPPVPIVRDVGLFAYPTASPFFANSSGSDIEATQPVSPTNAAQAGESRYFQVAYLQALVPQQSETSRYRLTVMDQDGSNRKILFPEEGKAGLDPQRVVWSPQQSTDVGFWVACIYQGNIWLVNSQTSLAQQITGDGLVSKVDWR